MEGFEGFEKMSRGDQSYPLHWTRGWLQCQNILMTGMVYPFHSVVSAIGARSQKTDF